MQKWDIVTSSIIGKSHESSKLPNQDSLAIFPENMVSGTPIIATISDGHGAERYHRSHLGSNLATLTSIAYIKLLLERFQRDNIKFQGIRDYCIEKFPQKLIQFWRRAVRESIGKYPYKEREENIYLPYGCTLLGVVIFNNILITFQLGDGDILFVQSTLEVSKDFGRDQNLIANETYSLCTNDAIKNFKVNVRRIDYDPPDLIIISTDGYSNSFKDDDSFYKAGKDFLSIIQNDGILEIQDNLKNWLKETSDQGSGDDTTMILLHRKK